MSSSIINFKPFYDKVAGMALIFILTYFSLQVCDIPQALCPLQEEQIINTSTGGVDPWHIALWTSRTTLYFGWQTSCKLNIPV